jgi:peptide/nickel transport system permease protein
LSERADAAASELIVVRQAPEVSASKPPARRWRAWSVPLEVIVGGVVLILVAGLVVLAPLITPIDPRALALDARLQPPSANHPFGTDDLGRDLFSRVLYGGRVSIGVGVAAAILSSALGAAVGVVAPINRALDMLIMRVVDGLMSIPAILLAIALVAVAGASVQNVIIAVTVVEIPRIARIIRSEVLSLRERPFIDAAVTVGSSAPQIILRHLLPGVASQLIVQATFVWAAAMMIEAGLSFIGAGTPPTTPSWGNIMADGRSLWQIRPNLIFIPAAFLSATLIAVNLLGDGLRKALTPRGRSRA